MARGPLLTPRPRELREGLPDLGVVADGVSDAAERGARSSGEQREKSTVTEAASTRQRSRPRLGHSGIPSRGCQLRESSAHMQETGEVCLVRAV